jgi:hypothetical protein
MTIVLSQKVENIAGILDVPGATLLDTLHTDDGGLTWKATLATSLNLVDAVNAVTLDLRGVHDAHGNAGSLVTSDNYVVDGTVTSYVEHAIDILDWSAPYDDHVSNSNNQVLSGTLSAPLLAGQHLMVSIDGAAEVEVRGRARRQLLDLWRRRDVLRRRRAHDRGARRRRRPSCQCRLHPAVHHRYRQTDPAELSRRRFRQRQRRPGLHLQRSHARPGRRRPHDHRDHRPRL